LYIDVFLKKVLIRAEAIKHGAVASICIALDSKNLKTVVAATSAMSRCCQEGIYFELKV
jgi:hypothetical protein